MNSPAALPLPEQIFGRSSFGASRRRTLDYLLFMVIAFRRLFFFSFSFPLTLCWSFWTSFSFWETVLVSLIPHWYGPHTVNRRPSPPYTPPLYLLLLSVFVSLLEMGCIRERWILAFHASSAWTLASPLPPKFFSLGPKRNFPNSVISWTYPPSMPFRSQT